MHHSHHTRRSSEPGSTCCGNSSPHTHTHHVHTFRASPEAFQRTPQARPRSDRLNISPVCSDDEIEEIPRAVCHCYFPEDHYQHDSEEDDEEDFEQCYCSSGNASFVQSRFHEVLLDFFSGQNMTHESPECSNASCEHIHEKHFFKTFNRDRFAADWGSVRTDLRGEGELKHAVGKVPQQLPRPKLVFLADKMSETAHPGIVISWAKKTPRVDILQYFLELRIQNCEELDTWVLIYQGTDKQFTCTRLPRGAKCGFRVRGENENGKGKWSEESVITVPLGRLSPSKAKKQGDPSTLSSEQQNKRKRKKKKKKGNVTKQMSADDKRKLEEQLIVAQRTGDSEELEAIIEKARGEGINIEQAEKTLRQLRRVSAVRASLQEALSSNNIEALEDAIELAEQWENSQLHYEIQACSDKIRQLSETPFASIRTTSLLSQQKNCEKLEEELEKITKEIGSEDLFANTEKLNAMNRLRELITSNKETSQEELLSAIRAASPWSSQYPFVDMIYECRQRIHKIQEVRFGRKLLQDALHSENIEEIIRCLQLVLHMKNLGLEKEIRLCRQTLEQMHISELRYLLTKYCTNPQSVPDIQQLLQQAMIYRDVLHNEIMDVQDHLRYMNSNSKSQREGRRCRHL